MIINIIILISCLTLNYHCKSNDGASDKGSISIIQSNTSLTMDTKEIDYIMGRFEPKGSSDFVVIPLEYADREGMLLRKETFNDFVKMHKAATAAGIKLVVRSATRNFDYQKGIWERKWTGKTKLSDGTDVSSDISSPKEKALRILEYSSMPGTSRHHWGTDIDLNSFDNDWFRSGEGLKIYNWLIENAHKYGFCQPYTEKGKDRMHGYNEEKWHWSYMPLSQEFTRLAEEELSDEMITGFLGAEQAKEIGVIEKYILGINKSCR